MVQNSGAPNAAQFCKRAIWHESNAPMGGMLSELDSGKTNTSSNEPSKVA